MSQFVESLSEGHNVNIIRFGTDAKVSLGGFSDIDGETKKALRQYIKGLYKRGSRLIFVHRFEALAGTTEQAVADPKEQSDFPVHLAGLH